jgi:hypothetical protein
MALLIVKSEGIGGVLEIETIQGNCVIEIWNELTPAEMQCSEGRQEMKIWLPLGY